MEDEDSVTSLRGLYQDLSVLSSSGFSNVDRLLGELHASIADLRKLLDKPAKSQQSRSNLQSGEVHLALLDGERVR